MTREEAIKTLRELWRETNDTWYEEVYNVAIEALQAKTDGDLISRADAIRWVKTECNQYGKPTLEFESGKRVIEHLKQMPSADRLQGWITCRERMPKKEEATYLICTETGHMCSCRWTNNMYGLGSNEWSKWGWHIMDKPQYAKVVAWMPLKPWKGADDGEDIQSADE